MLENGHQVVCAVTTPDKPKGRGLKLQASEVKKVALEHGIPVLQPRNLKAPEFYDELKSYNLDLAVIIAFRMLPESIWSMPKIGTFNLHASLLPNYRGAAPINHAIINGETKTGVTTFFLKHEIDTGDILLQEEVDIDENENVGELYHKLMKKGADLVEQTLRLIKKETYSLKQQTLLGTEKKAPKIYRDFCEISQELTVIDAHNKIRGLNPFPGAWCQSQKLGNVKLTETLKSEMPKTNHEDFFVHEGHLYWPCSNGALEIISLKISGKPKQSAKDIINGYFR